MSIDVETFVVGNKPFQFFLSMEVETSLLKINKEFGRNTLFHCKTNFIDMLNKNNKKEKKLKEDHIEWQ